MHKISTRYGETEDTPNYEEETKRRPRILKNSDSQKTADVEKKFTNESPRTRNLKDKKKEEFLHIKENKDEEESKYLRI